MIGGGKYHEEAEGVRASTNADGVILFVFNGVRGSGVTVRVPLDVLMETPYVLRTLADQIEVDLKNLSHGQG